MSVKINDIIVLENMFGGSTMQSGDNKTIERVYTYICNYIEKNQISPSATTWTDLEGIMLCEINHR